jgi:hypothetical protein
MRITIENALDSADIDRFYDLYTAAFLPIKTLAAARHTLTVEEFAAEMTDERIAKYVARSDVGQAVGLTTLTTDLTAVLWIEPSYYAARHPDHAARGAIFYLGYILVDPKGAAHRVFKVMADAVCLRVAKDRGVLCFDMCAHNADAAVGRFAAGMEKNYGAIVEVVDTQSYVTADFTASPIPTQRQIATVDTSRPVRPLHAQATGAISGC